MSPTIRVLYAEDNLLDADLTRAHFSKRAPDFELEIVRSGQACLDRLSSTDYDVLLLDHRLPDMEGTDVLRALPRTKVPVVMVTGTGDEDLVVKALRMGASSYVPKLGDYIETLPDLLRGVIEEFRLKRSQGLLLSTPRKVLYVEHHAMDVELTVRHFAEAAPHIELEVIRNCADALARLGRPPAYDAVMIDLRMPDQSGLDFVREAKRRGLELPPFVMISGLGDEAAAIASLKLGAADYVPKRKGYLDQITFTVDRAIAFDRLDRLNAQLQIELAERRRIEAELREKSLFLSTLMDAMPLPVFYKGTDGRYLGFNKAFEEFYGKTHDELVGRTVFDVAPRELAEIQQAKDDELFGSSGVQVYEAPMMDRDGQLHDLVYRKDTYTDADGRVAGLIGAMVDISARKKDEEALRFQKMLLESESEASIDGILIVDAGGKIMWSNRRFAELWTVSQDVLRTRSDEAVLQSVLSALQDPDAFLAKVRDLYAEPTAKSRDEIRLKDGRVFDRFSAPVVDDGGACLGRVWLFRDVTEERKLQAAVAQSDRLASMGMLAAGVAHEINNPLSYILYNLESLSEDVPRHARQLALARAALVGRLGEAGLSEILGSSGEALDPALSADMEERFEDALGGTRRIKEIARGLGTFSRVERAKVAPVDLRHAIESAISIATNEIKYRARLEQDFGPTAPVMASDGGLSQVFLNLLVNAAHSITEGDVEHNRIGVRTWQEGDEVCAEVRDTGCGIPPENVRSIFDPFFTTKPAGVGSGLGLHIVKNIVAGFGGRIEVASEVGAGTRFVIRLPAGVDEGAGAAVEAAETIVATGARGRVLVIDDEEGMRRAFRRLLREHEIVEAESGEQGRDLLAKDQAFDVILCDMMMPRVSGMDVHRWLLEHHPQLARKLVFVTGGAFTANGREYLEKVGNLRLEKPFDAKSVQKVIAELVSSSQGRD